MMKTSEYDAIWENPKNWKWHLFYSCKEDPRVIVPKRPKWMGRTLNFAHKRSYFVLLVTILAVILPVVLLPWTDFVVGVALLLVVCAAIVVFYYSCDLRIR